MYVVEDRCGTIGFPMDAAMIGPYRVTGVIGRGGMGAVYSGEHALLGRPAAIKVLLPELSQKQDVVMRFFNEARAATAIRHPGIIEIYDFGWTPDGAAFIVMERLEGDTLARRSQRSRFRWQGVLAIARQIAGALAAAHAKGIVHRDLKPDNVFLVPDPEVPGGERIKLLDFGIAKLAVDSTSTISVTKTGSVMGTPTYMAPEQCRGVTVDHRADLYALGCVIYELCCGRPPFVGEGPGDVLAAHIHIPVPKLSGAISDIPPAVEQLIHRLLAKVPADRVQSAEDVIQEIDAVLPERVGVSTGPRTVLPAATAPPVTTLSGSASTSMLLSRASRRSRWSIALVSAGLAVVTAVAVTAVMRGGDEVKPTSHAIEPSFTAPSGAAPSGAAPSGAAPSGVASVQPEPGAPSASAEPATAVPAGAPSPAPVAAGTPDRTAPAVESAVAAARPGAPSGTIAPKVSEPAKPPPDPSLANRAPGGAAEPPGGTIPAAGAAQEPPPPPSAVPPQDPERPATVDVSVESSPPGAQVMIDGNAVGKTPYHGDLPRRDRDIKLVLRLTGYVDKVVVARASRPITEHVRLVRIPAQSPSSPRNSKSKRDQSVNPF